MMAIAPDRQGHVAIIVTAREYAALATATAYYEVEVEVEGDKQRRGDLRALDGLLSKCRDAGIRTTKRETTDA